MKRPTDFKIKIKKEIFARILVSSFFLFVAIIYFHNLTRDIYSGDTGDLATAAYVFGVAHPPGYPLVTFLGFLFSHLPLGLPVVTKVGFLSVISCLTAIFLFYKFSYRVSKNIFIALLCCAVLAFSYEFWVVGELPEVFALNNFFAIALFYFAYLFFESEKPLYLFIFAFCAGLSLSNQFQIVAIFPFILLLIAYRFQFLWKNKLRVLLALGWFLLGFIPYVYIPFAASNHPVINWDSASNWQNFIRLVLRQDYKIFTPNAWFLTPREKIPILEDYFSSFADNYSWIMIFIGILGLVHLLRKNKRLFISLFLAFLISGPVFIFVIAAPIKSPDAIGILERFYVLSFVVFACFFPFGFLFLQNILLHLMKKSLYIYAALSIFFIIPFFMFIYNYPKTNLSSTHIGNDLGRMILKSVNQKNAILFVHADTMTFDTWYMHYVERIRPDITLVSISESGSTYFQDKMIQKYRATHKNTRLSRNEIMGQMLPEILKKQSIFSTAALPYQIPKGYLQVPLGVTYQLLPMEKVQNEFKYLSIVLPWLGNNSLPRRNTLSLAEQNLITPDITKFYSDSYYHIGNFLVYYYRDLGHAKMFYEKAIFIDDENSVAYANLAALQSLSDQTCSAAEKNIQQAIDLYPIYRSYYVSLYYIYDRCKTDKRTLEGIKREYLKIYKEPIEKSPTQFYIFP